MRFRFVIFFLLFSSLVFCQEIGSIQEGEHYVKLLKTDNTFSLAYSNVDSKVYSEEKSFHFSDKETLYAIIMDGFNTKKGRQVIVQTSKDTIVKFNYKKLNGEYKLYVYQNNLNNRTYGRSTFFTKDQIIKLFGEQYKG